MVAVPFTPDLGKRWIPVCRVLCLRTRYIIKASCCSFRCGCIRYMTVSAKSAIWITSSCRCSLVAGGLSFIKNNGPVIMTSKSGCALIIGYRKIGWVRERWGSPLPVLWIFENVCVSTRLIGFLETVSLLFVLLPSFLAWYSGLFACGSNTDKLQLAKIAITEVRVFGQISFFATTCKGIVKWNTEYMYLSRMVCVCWRLCLSDCLVELLTWAIYGSSSRRSWPSFSMCGVTSWERGGLVARWFQRPCIFHRWRNREAIGLKGQSVLGCTEELDDQVVHHKCAPPVILGRFQADARLDTVDEGIVSNLISWRHNALDPSSYRVIVSVARCWWQWTWWGLRNIPAVSVVNVAITAWHWESTKLGQPFGFPGPWKELGCPLPWRVWKPWLFSTNPAGQSDVELNSRLAAAGYKMGRTNQLGERVGETDVHVESLCVMHVHVDEFTPELASLAVTRRKK